MRIGPLRSTQFSSSRRVTRIPLSTSALNIPNLTANSFTTSRVLKTSTSISFDNDGVKLSRLQDLITELRHSYDTTPIQPQYTEVLTVRKMSRTVQDVIERTILAPMYTSTSRLLLSGENYSQIQGLHLPRFSAISQRLIEGEINAVAQAASASIDGDLLGKVTDDAQYQLSTDNGDYQFDIHNGEDLQTAADRINTDRQSSGVRASVVENKLVLTTDEIGSNAHFQLHRLDTPQPKIHGVNAAQLNNVQVAAQNIGADETISGAVLSQWSSAQMTYDGASDGTVDGSVSFRLTGNGGTALVTLNKGETLTNAANRLNGQLANTGVSVSVDNNALQFTSALQGAQSTVQISDIQRQSQTTVSGVNNQQATSIAVDSFQPSSRESLAGDVIRTASKATMTLQGAANATVISTATFEVQGARGTTNISITAGEQLSAVATRINDATAATGVTARVQNNQLVFESTSAGGAARIGVHLLSLPFTTSVTGHNGQQLSNFNADSFTAASSRAFSGNVTQAAGEAQISHHGSILGVGSNSSFTLTGALGSASFSTTTFQSLNNLANQVNLKTAQTGITATISGQDIYFRSTDVGSDAQVRLVVNSGSLSINGADVNGRAFGTDAKATVNGQSLTGSGNDFAFSDNLGSYHFSTVQDYTGAISPITVTGSTESFQLSGGDASGNAYGLNARATINGVQYDGNVNDFQLSTATGSYRLSFAQGFTGSFDPIDIQSNYDNFNVTGGDSNGAAYGTDFVAQINGQNYIGNDQTVHYATSLGTYDLTFRDDFVGAFDPIRINTSAGPILSGLDTNGMTTGSDATATINGQHLTGNANQFSYSDADMDFQFEVAGSFVGQIDPITIGYQTDVQQHMVPRTVYDTVERVVTKPQKSVTITTDASIDQSATTRNTQSILSEIDTLLSARAGGEEVDQPSSNTEPKDQAAAVKGLSISEIVARAQTFANLHRTLSQSALLGNDDSLSRLLDSDFGSIQSSLNQFA